MATPERAGLSTFIAQLEVLWARFDELFESFGPVDWQRRLGLDWTFADVPYHMAFFDQELMADAIGRGPDVPAAEQVAPRTFREMRARSADRFARRPPGQTPEQSLAQMRASRAAIRRAVAHLREADVAGRGGFAASLARPRPVWITLVSTRGWRTVGFALWLCLVHTWNEFMQLRLYA